MKLIREYTSLTDAEAFAKRLRKKGVLTQISSVNSKQLGAMVTGAVKVGVWVVLDEQADDAASLLNNKRHAVQHLLTEEEMKLLESGAKEQMDNSINTALKILGIAFGVIIVLVIAYSAL